MLRVPGTYNGKDNIGYEVSVLQEYLQPDFRYDPALLISTYCNNGTVECAGVQTVDQSSTLATGTSPKYQDSVVLDLLHGAKNCSKFRSLWQGSWPFLGYLSHSEADAALVSMIAFYTRDPEQISRIFSKSVLADRCKWLEKPGYRKRTIKFVLERQQAQYKGKELRHQANIGEEVLRIQTNGWQTVLRTAVLTLYTYGI